MNRSAGMASRPRSTQSPSTPHTSQPGLSPYGKPHSQAAPHVDYAPGVDPALHDGYYDFATRTRRVLERIEVCGRILFIHGDPPSPRTAESEHAGPLRKIPQPAEVVIYPCQLLRASRVIDVAQPLNIEEHLTRGEPRAPATFSTRRSQRSRLTCASRRCSNASAPLRSERQKMVNTLSGRCLGPVHREKPENGRDVSAVGSS